MREMEINKINMVNERSYCGDENCLTHSKLLHLEKSKIFIESIHVSLDTPLAHTMDV